MYKIINKIFFTTSHQLFDNSFLSTYNELQKNQWESYSELKKEQDKKLRKLVCFAYANVAFYKKQFDQLGITVSDIECIEDLNKLPVINKETIKNNWDDFKPIGLQKIKYYNIATGGSTGVPFSYRISKQARLISGCLTYRGWGYAGYELSDRMVFVGGSSLDIGSKASIIKKVHEVGRNIKKLSSFDMNDKDMENYISVINKFKPKFIRGYASAIYHLADWIKDNKIIIHQPHACLTTSEKLFPEMRKTIKEVFACDVFDGYGLNDGGLSAYECSEHNGLHIDTERSILEVIDEDGNQLNNEEGRIVATTLCDYAMPLIRYDTGDIGAISDENCSCGREYKLLKEIVGRSVDILTTPEGKKIHGWFFLYIFWKYCKGIKKYQVVQVSKEHIIIKIIPEKGFDETQLDEIRKIVKLRSQSWNLEFEFVDSIERTKAGKYKFIINELNS